VLVETKDSADYIYVISPPEEPDTNLFIIRSFFPSGKIRSVAKSFTNSFNVKYQGSYLEYYENGHKKAIENYNKGHLEGDIYEFYPNGNPYTIKTYSKSKGFRFQECRDSTGKLLVENGNGHL
jgi:antitoxin component YwqK of YwqJK toxin-antitoxin module